jgi:hypothetical protein
MANGNSSGVDNLLIKGNSKLGPDIWQWSITSVSTCPGRTKLCESLCYTHKGFFRYKSTAQSLDSREAERHKPDFVSRVNAEIEKHDIRTLRIHVSGDFDSVGYIKKWISIIDANPDTLFVFYTRSWRVKNLAPHIQTMANFKNVKAWLSCDKESGKPIDIKRARRAYMSVDDNDTAQYKVSITFRNNKKTEMLRTPHNSVVCPVERGGKEKSVDPEKLNCSTCSLCYYRASTADKLSVYKIQKQGENK